jgi:trigger factor
MSLKAVNQKETNRVELEIAVDAATFEAAVQNAYRKNIGKMNIPGFRRGKAPRQYVEKMFGTGVFYEDAVNDLYPTALDEAIKESGYEYVEDQIDLDVVSVDENGLVFKAVITVKPEVEGNDFFEEEIRHFITCLNEGKTPISPIDDAVTVQRMLDAIYRSAEAHAEVTI